VTRRNQIKLDICNAIVAAAGFAKTITNIVQELDTGAIFLSTDDHAVQIIFAIAVDSLEAIQAIAKGNHVWEKSGILGSPLTYAALYAASPDAVAKLLDRVPTPVLAPAAHFEELKKILHQTLKHTLAKRLSLVSQQLLAWIGKHMSPCDRLEFEARKSDLPGRIRPLHQHDAILTNTVVLKHALESDDLITVEMVLTMKTVKKPKSLRWKLLEHALRTCPASIGLLVAHGGLNPRQPGNSSAVMELAVELGAVDLVKTMLDFGADPNIPSPTDLTIKYVHRSYTQPLRIAVEAHHVDMVALLLQRGAILGGGIINNDLTLLKKAERYQDRRIYELLLAAQRREKLVQDADVI
jgi:hypothetical protein